MKIKSIAAVGAMGVGLGLASFIGGTGTASADCNAGHDPDRLERRRHASCNVDVAASFVRQTDEPVSTTSTFSSTARTCEDGSDLAALASGPARHVRRTASWASGRFLVRTRSPDPVAAGSLDGP